MELKRSSFNSLQHNQTKALLYKLSKLPLLALWVIISNLYMHSFPEKTKKTKTQVMNCYSKMTHISVRLNPNTWKHTCKTGDTGGLTKQQCNTTEYEGWHIETAISSRQIGLPNYTNTWVAMSATASAWLSLRPRARRFCARNPALCSINFSTSRGTNFISTKFSLR